MCGLPLCVRRIWFSIEDILELRHYGVDVDVVDVVPPEPLIDLLGRHYEFEILRRILPALEVLLRVGLALREDVLLEEVQLDDANNSVPWQGKSLGDSGQTEAAADLVLHHEGHNITHSQIWSLLQMLRGVEGKQSAQGLLLPEDSLDIREEDVLESVVVARVRKLDVWIGHVAVAPSQQVVEAQRRQAVRQVAR